MTAAGRLSTERPRTRPASRDARRPPTPTMPHPPSPTDHIEQQIVLDAPRERVWRALTDVREFNQWFGVALTTSFAPGAVVRGPSTIPAAGGRASSRTCAAPWSGSPRLPWSTVPTSWRPGVSTAVRLESDPRAVAVEVTDDIIAARLADGRTISVPLAWSWRLAEATPTERARYELLGDGTGIHWPDVDEDISVRGMLDGVPAPRPR